MLLLLLLLGCEDPPDPCAAMCAVATETQAACLAEEGVDWTAAGYADRADYRDACDTWAWEARLLEDDAGEDGAVDETCRTRRETLSGGACDELAAIDWSTLPWEDAASGQAE